MRQALASRVGPRLWLARGARGVGSRVADVWTTPPTEPSSRTDDSAAGDSHNNPVGDPRRPARPGVGPPTDGAGAASDVAGAWVQDGGSAWSAGRAEAWRDQRDAWRRARAAQDRKWEEFQQKRRAAWAEEKRRIDERVRIMSRVGRGGISVASAEIAQARATLGLPRVGPVTRAQVQSAFRSRALATHPDRTRGETAATQRQSEEAFKQAAHAYETLMAAAAFVD